MKKLSSQLFAPCLKTMLAAIGLLFLVSQVHAGDLASTPFPVVKIDAKYPPAAARERIEGYVVMSFTITEVGNVEDIVVLKSFPDEIFEREAKRALKKWKYKPKVEDGKVVRQTDMQVQIDFILN